MSIVGPRPLMVKYLPRYNEHQARRHEVKDDITCNIIAECKKLVLFTASYSGYSLMNEIDKKTGKRFIPENVFLHLSHLNPEYMGLHYLNELKGKVDLLVIGFGGGSQISDLVRFIRYAK